MHIVSSASDTYAADLVWFVCRPSPGNRYVYVLDDLCAVSVETNDPGNPGGLGACDGIGIVGVTLLRMHCMLCSNMCLTCTIRTID